MIFSSPEFIFAFLPIVFLGYFSLTRQRLITLSKMWLVLASLVFYSYWSILYLPLLLGSVAFNFFVGAQLSVERPQTTRKSLLAAGIVIDLAMLGYFKYAHFFVANLDRVTGSNFAFPAIALPLGISFFTFTQIAYLVDSYRRTVNEYGPVNYALFVTFFPHLIAGPILHHREMMSQFASLRTVPLNFRKVLMGLFIFSIGLFKKVVIADTFAIWANAGYGGTGAIDFFSAWATGLSYTFQLYFDFSGYCDMAIGAALLFNIWLPINFNSPYKALDIQDFWRRWHITLSRFLRDYLYIPLGGNRASEPRVLFNLFVTFLLGGLWHGASWMFVAWGALHGAGLISHRLWRHAGLRLPKPLAWAVTFLFVDIAWVLFRSATPHDAERMFLGMIDVGSANYPVSQISSAALSWGGQLSDLLLRLMPTGLVANFLCLLAIVAAFGITWLRNSQQLLIEGVGVSKTIGAAVIFCAAVYVMLATSSPVFLYFNF